MHILLLDNYDSFTYNLYDYILRSGASCEVWRNDALSLTELQTKSFDALCLSPGPGVPADSGILMETIAWAAGRKPMLGICLGLQAIGQHFGANLVRAAVPMHGKTSLIEHHAAGLFEGIALPMQVMRYHSLVLESLEHTPLKISAESPSGEIMALEHPELPIWAVQFHPESILTPDGLRLIENWLVLVEQRLSMR
jgi:anthranilate synthase component 2/para-aminobenzoate synthetase component 2